MSMWVDFLKSWWYEFRYHKIRKNLFGLTSEERPCAYITKAGTQCKRSAKPYSKFCGRHLGEEKP